MSDSPRVSRLAVAAAYDRWATFYDNYDNPMVFLAAEAVRRSVAPLARGARVFEFGCGTGRNLARLREAGAASVAGCDFSAGMLAAARARDASLRLERFDMTAPGAHVAGHAEGSVDLVLFCLTLEHVEKPAGPLAEARRLLAAGPHARVAVIEIHPFLSLGGTAAHFEENGERVEMPAFPHQFADYLGAFAAAGLHVESCREWRPRDVEGTAAPAKLLKRGPDFPAAVEFLLSAAR